MSEKARVVMPEHSKLIERIIVGLAASAISVDVLAIELPRVLPYLIALVVLFVVVRLVLFHTRKW
jgi:hypothetical protein